MSKLSRKSQFIITSFPDSTNVKFTISSVPIAYLLVIGISFRSTLNLIKSYNSDNSIKIVNFPGQIEL